MDDGRTLWLENATPTSQADLGPGRQRRLGVYVLAKVVSQGTHVAPVVLPGALVEQVSTEVARRLDEGLAIRLHSQL